MKPEIKEKWVEALRSGEYKQDKGFLRTEDGYCCLGVLCDIYSKETGKGQWMTPNDIVEGIPFAAEGYQDSQTLPDPVRVWADLGSSKGVFDWNEAPSKLAKQTGLTTNVIRSWQESGHVDLTQFNDNYVSFKRIARLIEEEF